MWGTPIAIDVPHIFSEYEHEIKDRTGQSWGAIKYLNDLNPIEGEFLEKGVFVAHWIVSLLRDAFGFNQNENSNIPFQPYNGPVRQGNDARPEMSWTLGVIFIEACQRIRNTDPPVLQVIGPWEDEPVVTFASGEPSPTVTNPTELRCYMSDTDDTDNLWKSIIPNN